MVEVDTRSQKWGKEGSALRNKNLPFAYKAIRTYHLSHPDNGFAGAGITDAISNPTLLHQIYLSNEEDPCDGLTLISIRYPS